VTRPGALGGAVVVIAGLLVVGALAPPAAAAVPSIPLSTAAAGTGGDVAVLAMGHLDDPANTFWQLLYRSPGGRWRLRTPPGVADNGGLALAIGSSTVTITAGFVPTADLTFSPLASTANAGSSWTTGNVIPFGLEAVPDALTGPGPSSLWALVRGGRGAPVPAGGAVVSGGTTTGRWSTLVTRNALALSGPGRRCGLQSLTAVMVTAPSTGVLGGSCTVAGQVGLFSGGPGHWRLVGPRLPSGAVTVVRLAAVGPGLDALLAVRQGGSTQFVAAWGRTASGPWRLTSGLATSTTAGLCSSSTTALGGFVVLVRERAGCQAALASPATTRWQHLPDPPTSTAVVLDGDQGTIDALTVRSTVFADFRLTSAGTWQRVQTMRVPIQFGSSS
jgi:hypothetical protein